MKTRTFYLGHICCWVRYRGRKQKSEGQLPVAQDYYSGGNFNEALRLLEGTGISRVRATVSITFESRDMYGNG